MEMPVDNWRPVKGFEDYYLVSKDGEIYSLITNIQRKKVINRSNGYLYVVLVNPENGERKTATVHRIVADVWVPNPDNLPCINHINENKTDNRADNLEWCTRAYNNTYNGKTQRCCKPILQIDPNDLSLIAEWPSARKADAALNISYQNISAVCRGVRNYAGGFIWRFI